MSKIKGSGTADQPWRLTTPPGTSEYQAYRDEGADPPALVVQVMYVPPVLEALGLAEVEHNSKNNRMRAAVIK